MAADLVVYTDHSRYEFDTAAKTVARTRLFKYASDLGDDGEARTYRSFTEPVRDEPMYVYYTDAVGPRVSTVVTGVFDKRAKAVE